ncbi:2-dehydro-3-deoxygalactonokinase [Sphingomonas prati]|uniref:2-dehydro-3-deoxygalactonokinase n=1 Tax=Sphingomonas prati TaxID=1843237 RepID=A0A7W9EZX3_9SPHN|nr:2-dehydro-3-deoxygalactonokinase [Sphingomonas prati]MBB5727623.1 2-dehydro-3-deoxygalactonokinase [Sphingomonas prati]GGE79451.1 2-dehydro-3-deoxygalactonokinase [Sphingomonas prati]
MTVQDEWRDGDRVAGDWGTSRLRLFHLRGDAVMRTVTGPGIAAVMGAPGEALIETLAPWFETGLPRDAEVALCGMVGSRNGIAEVPYAECPASLDVWRLEAHAVAVGGLRVVIAPGLACTRNDGAADVMRGEETQIFGLLSLYPALARGRHVIALPGTHGKWAEVVDGRVVRFRTFLTGELFALLRDQSTLTRAGADDSGGEDGFVAGLERSDAGGLLGSLFEARAAQLREGRSRGWAVGFLSGLTIGHEVREGLAGADREGTVMLVGDPVLTALYTQALARHGRAAETCDGSVAARAGLRMLGERP